MPTETNYSCSRCQASLSTEDARCPACGSSSPHYVPSSDARPVEKKTPERIVDNPWLVLGSIFLAFAAFGIPLIWASRAFSPAAKWFWTIVTIAYTALVLWLFYLVMAWSWSNISRSL